MAEFSGGEKYTHYLRQVSCPCRSRLCGASVGGWGGRWVVARGGCVYRVIDGPPGSGKSTTFKRLACGTDGVIYISIESDTDAEKGVSQAIIDALGGLPPASFLGAIWANLVGGEFHKPAINLSCQWLTWQQQTKNFSGLSLWVLTDLLLVS